MNRFRTIQKLVNSKKRPYNATKKLEELHRGLEEVCTESTVSDTEKRVYTRSVECPPRN
jgi:hypothetical protein